jgi:hypothetical protein
VAVMKAGVVKGLAHELFPSFLRQRKRAKILDQWARGEQQHAELHEVHGIDGMPFTPEETTAEFKNLTKLSPTPLGGLIVRSLSQTLYVEGVRRPDSKDNMEVWNTWQANGWDAKQIALHQAAIRNGLSFSRATPGKDPLTGDRRAKMDAFSALRMAAFYDEPNDEWASVAIQADPVFQREGFFNEWTVTVTDDEADYFLSCENNGYDLDDWTFISYAEHGMPVVPVVQYSNSLDLDGNASGELDAILPMLARVDQDTFDRLIVQRYGAWKVRYIAGMAKPDTDAEARAAALRLSVQDLLVSEDADTKFGTLDASDMKQFLEATDHDLRMIAAITQTPPHHLLGLSSNLQSEALAAATEGLMRKSGDFRMLNGESHEKNFRLVALANGNREEARATDMQVRWRDTESRSLVSTANALALIATGLKVPVEMLWERIPGWSDQDSERAKLLVEDGSFDKLVAEMEAEAAAVMVKKTAEAAPAESTGGSSNEKKS